MSDGRPATEGEVIRCTVDGCTWTLYPHPLDDRIGPDTLASVFGPGVFAATARTSKLHETEQAVAAHMRTHEPVEWLRTIGRLRGLLASIGVDPDLSGDSDLAGVPVQLLLAGPGDLLDLAAQYGVEVSPDDQVTEVVRRIVEAARR